MFVDKLGKQMREGEDSLFTSALHDGFLIRWFAPYQVAGFSSASGSLLKIFHVELVVQDKLK